MKRRGFTRRKVKKEFFGEDLTALAFRTRRKLIVDHDSLRAKNRAL
jgi:hypothetical protein